MKIGYILTDFPLWSSDGTVKQLKTASYIIKDSKYGNIIIDAGSPYSEKEFTSDLYKFFQLQPDDIDYVLLTHCHPDHFGLSYLFENADILVPAKDYELSKNLIHHFLSGKSVYRYMIDNCGDYKTTFSLNDEKNVEKYLGEKWCHPDTAERMKIKYIEDDHDLLQYIKPVLTKGHTFDHYSYILKTDILPIFFCGDAVANRMILLTDNKVITEAQMGISDYLTTIDYIKNVKGVLACGHDMPFNAEDFKSYRKNIIFENCR